jgi:hypothetical protein
MSFWLHNTALLLSLLLSKVNCLPLGKLLGKEQSDETLRAHRQDPEDVGLRCSWLAIPRFARVLVRSREIARGIPCVRLNQYITGY